MTQPTQYQTATRGQSQITQVTVEHVVVPSDLPFDDVIVALESRIGLYGNWEVLPHLLASRRATWEEVAELTLPLIGTSGFTSFVKMEQGVLLSLTGKPKRITLYALGNHLLGVHMIEEVPEVGLYAPPRLVVYEDYTGRTFIAYDRLASLVSQYGNPQVSSMAALVDQKMHDLALAAAGTDL